MSMPGIGGGDDRDAASDNNPRPKREKCKAGGLLGGAWGYRLVADRRVCPDLGQASARSIVGPAARTR